MREELRFNKEHETIDAYMTKAAQVLRVMNGASVAVSPITFISGYEAEEYRGYVFELAMKVVKKEFGSGYTYAKGMVGQEQEFYGYFFELLVENLPVYNDGNHLVDGTKKYKFSTFLGMLASEATKRTYAFMHHVPTHVMVQILQVRKIRKELAIELGVSEDKISPIMIVNKSQRSYSEKEVMALLEIAGRNVSFEKMHEEGCLESELYKVAAEDDRMEKLLGLDVDMEKLFDAFFSKLSDMQKFFVLVHVGCEPAYDKMTAEQLSADEMFVRIIEANPKFCKNVLTGTVVSERPDRRSVLGAEALVLENVKYVKTTLIRYQRDEAKKTLRTLKNGLNCSDIVGKCGLAYFMKQWEELKEKYNK